MRHPELPITIVDIHAGDANFQSVIGLWRQARQWLGFMPTAGFEERAEAGRLLGAVVQGRVVGYLLYDLPHHVAKVIHLCVEPTQRNGGIARRLVAEVSSRHVERQGIQLSCRRDYPASQLWPKLGFVAVGERTGRGKDREPLTVWFRRHGHVDLFTYRYRPDAPDLVALGYDVYRDLVEKRSEGAPSRYLEDDWVTELITLGITDEVLQEINKVDNIVQRESLRSHIGAFVRLSSPREVDSIEFPELIRRVASVMPIADAADHRHLVRAIVNDARYFVTRNDVVLTNAGRLADEIGISVLRPEELIAQLDRTRSKDRYAPTVLNATALQLSTTDIDQGLFLSAFVNVADGERKHELASVVQLALAQPKRFDVLVVGDSERRYLACVITERGQDTLKIHALRVAGRDDHSAALARQLAFRGRGYAAAKSIARVEVFDSKPSRDVVEALLLEGYADCGGNLTSRVERGIGRDETPRLESQAASIERVRWPRKVLGAGVKTFMLPIRIPWAEQLFDSTLASRTLFPRETGLGVSREHVYYRKPRNAHGLAPPSRILWYVSGKNGAQNEGHVRAVSQLAEVAVGEPSTIHKRFSRLGVYEESQVIASADNAGEVMALRFTDTEVFANPVSLTRLREIWSEGGSRFSAPRSPMPVDEALFESTYREASLYGG